MQLGNTKLHIRTIILSALPLLILIAYIALMGLDIPFWDQWEMVPLLAKMKQGSLTFADLFSQHNEHRPFFPRLLWLMAAQLTGYNTTAELWMNLDITLVTFGAFSVYSAWVGRTQRIEILNSILPVATLLVFNLAQWESWLMGFQTVMFLGMLAVVMGFIILSRFNNWYGLLGGALLGSVATFSIASATLYWPIGFLIIIALSKPNNRLWRSAIWLIVSALILSVFFRNWSPSNNVSWDIFLQKPVLYFNWVLNFLGAPLLRYRYARIFGIISLIWIVVVGFRALRTTPASLLTPYWAIIGFILISALTIGIGRSSISIRSSLASRYLTLTVWYWVSLLALLPLSQLSIRVQRLVKIFMVLMLFVCTLSGGLFGYEERYLRTLPAYQAIRSGGYVKDSDLIAIYDVSPAIVRERLDILCQYNWSVCQSRRRGPTLHATDSTIQTVLNWLKRQRWLLNGLKLVYRIILHLRTY